MGTNSERAAKADRVVSNYESDSALEESLSGLLGDLRHLCDKYGLDFAERDGVGHRNYLRELAEERQAAEPAYTVIGIYRENENENERYATTVYTHNGPGVAEQLAQAACREDNQAETGEDLIEIAAVIEGEVRVLA